MTNLDWRAMRQQWLATCTVPDHPQRCPKCGKKVKICHMNLNDDAMFACSNLKCPWPLNAIKASDCIGFSDFNLYFKWKRAQKSEKRDKKKKRIISEDIASGSKVVNRDDDDQRSPSINPFQPESSGSEAESIFFREIPEKKSFAQRERCNSESSGLSDADMESIQQFFNVPRPLSPMSTCSSIAPSPAHETEFRKPTPNYIMASPRRTPNPHLGSPRQAPGSPWTSFLNRTPLPTPMSPLPMTPQRHAEDDSDFDSSDLGVAPLDDNCDEGPSDEPSEEEPNLVHEGKPKDTPTTSTNRSRAPRQSQSSDPSKPISIDPKLTRSLGNKLSMTTGLAITVSILDEASEKSGLESVTEKMKTKIDAFDEEEGNEVFRKLMKQLGADKDDDPDLEFIQRIQSALLGEEDGLKSDVIKLHVGHNKSTIDLPSATLDVSRSGDGKTLLSADSDGLDGQALRLSNSTIDFGPSNYLRKPGRPAKARPATSTRDQSTTNSGPWRFTFPTEPQTLPEPQAQYRQFFSSSENMTLFQRFLDEHMRNFECPDAFTTSGIDPIIAMLVSRMNDPYSFDQRSFYQSILEMYAIYFQIRCSQSQQVQNDRVKEKTVTQEAKTKPQSPLRPHVSSLSMPSASSSSSSEVLNGKPKIKEEVIELPSTPSTPGSVMLSSVHPPVQSVQEVSKSGHVVGKVGQGQYHCSITYEKSHIGPILVESEEEALVLSALLREKVNDRKNRKRKLIHREESITAAAAKARSILSPEVLQYVDQAFTEKGLKEHIIGRKKRNYPKRSEIIKINENGEHIHPAHRAETLRKIKQEQPQASSSTNSVPSPEKNIQKRVSDLVRSSNVYIRPTQEKRLKTLLKKQEKKRVYKGFVSKKEREEERQRQEMERKRPVKNHFVVAKPCSGVKKVLTANGEVIEVRVDDENNTPTSAVKRPKHTARINSEEKSILDELFALADELQTGTNETATQPKPNPADACQQSHSDPFQLNHEPSQSQEDDTIYMPSFDDIF